MPGIAALGKLFFEKKCVRETVAYVPAAAHAGLASNRTENNPAQIGAEEQTSHRDRC
jgi:hypothetical protein